MPDQTPERPSSIASQFGYWTAIYAAYLFLAGWIYLDHYFAVLGMSSNWLDFGFNDVVAHGFVVLFHNNTGKWLSGIYLVLLFLSLVAELLKKRSRPFDAIVAIVMAALFVPTFFIARRAGIDSANTDRGPSTTLSTITFSEKGCTYRGKLITLKGGWLFVHSLTPVDASRAKGVCPIEIGQPAGDVPQLWLIRDTDLDQDIRIVHYKKEAKP